MIAFYFELVLVVIVAGAASLLALVAWARFSPDPDQSVRAMIRQAESQTVFLFEGMDLVDCTPPARKLWDGLPRGGTDLQRFLRGLEPRFSGLPKFESIDIAIFQGEFSSNDPTSPLKLKFEGWNGRLRATLGDGEADEKTAFGIQSLELGSDELKMLRATTDEAPLLMWHTDQHGIIEWANEAYFQTLTEFGLGEPNHWPPAPLFVEVQANPPKPNEARRVALGKQTARRAFEITCLERGPRRLFFALSADAAENAENARREFVQTLTKTFAQLSVGLAIFDQNRRLALFNPALLTLVRLPAEFLIQKPTLHAFLDRLRENKLIAEPKDYRSWRKRLVELETKATDGSYCETWTLPGGLTFRVTGRPHPDGAIAFLFEDISAEMSLTRRFHAQIETGLSALDAFEEAIVIVNSLGATTLANKAYKALFDRVHDDTLAPQRIDDLFADWRALAGDVPEWDSLKTAMDRKRGPMAWRGHIETEDGRTLTCRMQKLGNGETLIGFTSSKSEGVSLRGPRSGPQQPLGLDSKEVPAQRQVG